MHNINSTLVTYSCLVLLLNPSVSICLSASNGSVYLITCLLPTVLRSAFWGGVIFGPSLSTVSELVHPPLYLLNIIEAKC